MKSYSIYEIVNVNGNVEYVGMTTNPEKRWYTHNGQRPNEKHRNGKFYKRSDVSMVIVNTAETRNEALQLEKELKIKYGFETTEFAWQSAGQMASDKVSKGWETRRKNGWVCPPRKK